MHKLLKFTSIGVILSVLLTACAMPSSTTASETTATQSQETQEPGTAAPPTIDEVLSLCPAAADIAAVDADLTLIFEADPTAGTLVCSSAEGSSDLTRLQERAYQAILMMKQFQFNQPLPWTGLPLYDWFVQAIDGIRFRSDIDLSFCCDPENYINIQTNNLAALSTSYWIDSRSGAGLQGLTLLYVHEARHNEIGGHTCGNQDNTVNELGAWGVQVSLLDWMAAHSDPTFLTTSDPNALAYSTTYYIDMIQGEADWTRANFFCQESNP